MASSNLMTRAPRFGLGLALAAGVFSSTLAQTTPQPLPGPPPQMSGMSALTEGMMDYLRETRGDAFWPNGVRMGPLTEENVAVRQLQRVAADMIEIAGQINGPGGYSLPVNRAYANAGGSAYSILPDGAVIGFVGRAEAGRLNFAIGLRRDEVNHMGSLAQVASGTQVNLSLGGGYMLNAVISQRPATDLERRRNIQMAQALAEAENRARETGQIGGAPAGDEPGPVIMQSPFTNSVIRQGDGRAPRP
jgi:hypothetical protein